MSDPNPGQFLGLGLSGVLDLNGTGSGRVVSRDQTGIGSNQYKI